jgi:hypothetical protein
MAYLNIYIICTCVVQGLWYKTFNVTESDTLWIDLPSKLPPQPTKDITPPLCRAALLDHLGFSHARLGSLISKTGSCASSPCPSQLRCSSLHLALCKTIKRLDLSSLQPLGKQLETRYVSTRSRTRDRRVFCHRTIAANSFRKVVHLSWGENPRTTKQCSLSMPDRQTESIRLF